MLFSCFVRLLLFVNEENGSKKRFLNQNNQAKTATLPLSSQTAGASSKEEEDGSNTGRRTSWRENRAKTDSAASPPKARQLRLGAACAQRMYPIPLLPASGLHTTTARAMARWQDRA